MTHHTPRYITMPASCLATQLVGDQILEHELCSLIFRRLRQIDVQVLYKGADGPSRHMFEVDFSVSALVLQIYMVILL
jgi:hypothetical protein